jgi:hypothetical protein
VLAIGMLPSQSGAATVSHYVALPTFSGRLSESSRSHNARYGTLQACASQAAQDATGRETRLLQNTECL